MQPLRIVFFGTPEFASTSLQSLLDADEHVVAVVTQPDRKQGRNQRLQPPPVKVLAETHSIPVVQPNSVRTPEFLEWFVEQKADVAVVVAYGKIIPRELLDAPPHGFVNVHGSILPKYRGASPIQSALIHGETESGVTIMKMDEGLDTGPMYLVRRIQLSDTMTAAELHDRLAVVGGGALVEMLQQLRLGTVELTPQADEHATHAPLLKKADGRVDWTLRAKQVADGVRGRYPWPGSYCFHNGKRIRLLPLEKWSDHSKFGAKPGQITQVSSNAIWVQTGLGTVLLGKCQLEGKKALPPAEFLNGYTLREGDVLD